MKTHFAVCYAVVFAASFVVGIGYASGATCTHEASNTCPGYGADNAINGNCCVVLYQIPVECTGFVGHSVKNVTVCNSTNCGVLAPVNESQQCGSNTETTCGQLAGCVGCESSSCGA